MQGIFIYYYEMAEIVFFHNLIELSLLGKIFYSFETHDSSDDGWLFDNFTIENNHYHRNQQLRQSIDSFENSTIDCFTEKLKTVTANLSDYTDMKCDGSNRWSLDYSANRKFCSWLRLEGGKG